MFSSNQTAEIVACILLHRLKIILSETLTAERRNQGRS